MKKKKKRNKYEDYILEIHLGKLKPLTECSHTLGIDGKDVAESNPSEYATVDAFWHFQEGQKISMRQFLDVLEKTVAEEGLLQLVDAGVLALMFDERDNEFKYFVTEKGQDRVSNL